MALQRYFAGQDNDAYTPEDLITGEKQVTTLDITIQSGAGVIPRFSVMGIITANGEAVISDGSAGDGSEIPRYITSNEEDATSQAVVTQAFASGCFNPDLLNIGANHDADSIKEALRDRGIQLKQPA